MFKSTASMIAGVVGLGMLCGACTAGGSEDEPTASTQQRQTGSSGVGGSAYTDIDECTVVATPPLNAFGYRFGAADVTNTGGSVCQATVYLQRYQNDRWETIDATTEYVAAQTPIKAITVQARVSCGYASGNYRSLAFVLNGGLPRTDYSATRLLLEC